MIKSAVKIALICTAVKIAMICSERRDRKNAFNDVGTFDCAAHCRS